MTEKRDSMLEHMKTLRDKTVCEWEEVLKQAKTTTSEYVDNIDQLENKLKARAKDMHKQVDAILAKSQQTLNQMKAVGLTKLQDQEKYLEDKLQQLQTDVQRYEDQLQHGDPNALIQFKQDTRQSIGEMKPPAIEVVSAPIFSKGQNYADAIETMFGQLSAPKKSRTVPEKSNSDSSSPDPAATCSAGQPKVSSPQSSATKKSLIPQPSVQSKFDVNRAYPRIACVERSLAWVQTGDKKLQLMDRDGSVRDNINTDFDFLDITITSAGDLLLTDCDNNCIKSVSRHKFVSTLFRTSGKPWGLCCLHNGDIVVTLRDNSKVLVYSSNGQIKQKMDDIKFRCPMSVSVNKVNQDIYICDYEKDSFDSPGKVLAIGDNGQLQYEYTGQSSSKFIPVEVCTDHMGHVLITDCKNEFVHIMDREGQFIQYILTEQQGLSLPNTISVDEEGYVWVGECNRCVKVARYLR